jgi:hypothetical protein
MSKPSYRHIDQSNGPLPHKKRLTTMAARPSQRVGERNETRAYLFACHGSFGNDSGWCECSISGSPSSSSQSAHCASIQFISQLGRRTPVGLVRLGNAPSGRRQSRTRIQSRSQLGALGPTGERSGTGRHRSDAAPCFQGGSSLGPRDRPGNQRQRRPRRADTPALDSRCHCVARGVRALAAVAH